MWSGSWIGIRLCRGGSVRGAGVRHLPEAGARLRTRSPLDSLVGRVDNLPERRAWRVGARGSSNLRQWFEIRSSTPARTDLAKSLRNTKSKGEQKQRGHTKRRKPKVVVLWLRRRLYIRSAVRSVMMLVPDPVFHQSGCSGPHLPDLLSLLALVIPYRF